MQGAVQFTGPRACGKTLNSSRRGMEDAEGAEQLAEASSILALDPCCFRLIRVIRDKAVQPRLPCSANSAPSFPLRVQFKTQRPVRDISRRTPAVYVTLLKA